MSLAAAHRLVTLTGAGGIAPDDPDVLANAAVVLGSLGEDIDDAIGSIDRSLVLNPSFARRLGMECQTEEFRRPA
jgi:hypothetical protein